MPPHKYSRAGFLKTALLAAFFFCFAVGLLRAAQLPGDIRVYEVKGQPAQIILKDGTTPPIRVGESLPNDATIRTPSSSSITLIFSNGAMMVIQPGSELQVAYLCSDPASPALPAKPKNTVNQFISDTDVKLKSGLIMLDVPPQNKKSNFQVTTPLGIACIRGTRFFVQVAKNLALVGVLEGKVLTNSLTGDRKMVGPGSAVAMAPAGFVESGASGAALRNQTLSVLQALGTAARRPIPVSPKSPSSRASYNVSE